MKKKRSILNKVLGKKDDIDKKLNKQDDLFPFDPLDEFPITSGQSQKPESFHRYILENQYQDLERSIRGIKEVWDYQREKKRLIKKKQHCFTEEEAEDILATVQSHLSSDIKLSYINIKTYGEYMVGLFQQFKFLFRSIAEYNYGRYGDEKTQYDMKLQNLKILIELWSRVQANYSRAIGGTENKLTHENIKVQESLNTSGSNFGIGRGFF